MLDADDSASNIEIPLDSDCFQWLTPGNAAKRSDTINDLSWSWYCNRRKETHGHSKHSVTT
jgi:hypothetical protein